MAGLALAGLLVTACGGSPAVAEGIVVEVEGGLVEVQAFSVRTPEGEMLRFVPAPGLRFEEGAALSHLREHLLTGEPVRVRYEPSSDGSLVALEVADSP